MRPAAAILADLFSAGTTVHRMTGGLRRTDAPPPLPRELQTEAEQAQWALAALLSGRVPALPADCGERAGGWPRVAHEAARTVRAALDAAGAEWPAVRTFAAVDALVAAWRARVAPLAERMPDAAAAAWRAVWAGEPEPEPLARGASWGWSDAAELQAAREALRRGLAWRA